MNKKFNKNDPGPGQYEVPSMFDRHATPLWFLSKVFNSRKNKNKKSIFFKFCVHCLSRIYFIPEHPVYEWVNDQPPGKKA